MSKKTKLAIFILVLLVAALVVSLYIFGVNPDVLVPKGMIAMKERNLLIIATCLMLIVVIPVLFLTFYFAWKYRASNTKAEYAPDWDHHSIAEYIWWGVPCAIIAVLAALTWIRTSELDPFRPIEGSAKPVRIQVVALQWKWLFIYPEYNIASVNVFHIPEKTPIHFEITADAPMNSFWLPALSGQVFAMPAMRTQLHIIADKIGVFRGSSANISGRGFSGMTFIAKSTSEDEFSQWVQTVQQSSKHLGQDEYDDLAKPSSYDPESFYSLQEKDLFDRIVMKYMMPMQNEK